MKAIPRHTKSIEIGFTNIVTDDVCFRITIPLTTKNRFRLSSVYKNLKLAVAMGEGVPAWRISGSHKIIDSEKIGRVLYEWRGGIALDMPDDATAYDYSIVLAQLDVMAMRFKQPFHNPLTTSTSSF